MELKVLLIMIGAFLFLGASAVGALIIFSQGPATTEDIAALASPEPTPSPPAEAAFASPSPTPQPIQTTQPQPSPSTHVELPVLYSLINAHRKENNLPILKVHTSLEQSAFRKLQDMIASKYWQHEDQQGVINWQVFEQSGYHYQLAGENLSFGNNTEWSIFSSWVASPQHNQQLLEPRYEDMGAAIDCTTYQEAGQVKCMAVLHVGKQQL